ncbi:MAG: carboxypeptidase regulatory-like domain-containing protein, partial [Myxococcales bacterium]|nr:carboxypeptidase regulatory-like domain-containing protein [Myxococcales bacterium]
MADERGKGKLLALLLLVLALIAGGAWWWLHDGDARVAEGAEGDEAPAKVDREAALRQKREARESGLDLTPVAVGGRVLRADDGTPIPGATVLLSRKGIVQGQAPQAGEPSRPLLATTDAGGAWSLPGVEPGAYLLSATAEGFLPGTRADLRIRGGEARSDLDLRLRVGGS